MSSWVEKPCSRPRGERGQESASESFTLAFTCRSAFFSLLNKLSRHYTVSHPYSPFFSGWLASSHCMSFSLDLGKQPNRLFIQVYAMKGLYSSGSNYFKMRLFCLGSSQSPPLHSSLSICFRRSSLVCLPHLNKGTVRPC